MIGKLQLQSKTKQSKRRPLELTHVLHLLENAGLHADLHRKRFCVGVEGQDGSWLEGISSPLVVMVIFLLSIQHISFCDH